MLAAILVVLGSYVVGSIPAGLLIGRKVKGKLFNIRFHGSGGIGFTNAVRALGWKAAVWVFLADFMKGFGPVALASLLKFNDPVVSFCFLLAMIGHARSFILFLMEGDAKGGKSVGTALGGLAFLLPWTALVGLAVWVILVPLTGFVSVSSIMASWSAFFFTRYHYHSVLWDNVTLLVAILITLAHLPNLLRLIHHAEPRWNDKRKEESVWAFMVHSVTLKDMMQSVALYWLYILYKWKIVNLSRLQMIIKKMTVTKVDEIRGIEFFDGTRARIIIIALPWLPEQILDEKNHNKVMDRLREAVIMARECGAEGLTLGAVLSTGTKTMDLQKWVDEQGLEFTIFPDAFGKRVPMPMDNGGPNTGAALIEALVQTVPDLGKKIVGILGGFGVIGGTTSIYMRNGGIEVGEVRVFARNIDRQTDMPIGEMIDINDREKLRECDVLIFALTAKDLVTAANVDEFVGKNAVIFDVGVPPNVNDDVLPLRKLIRCGLTLFPGKVKSRIDYHFYWTDEGGVTHNVFPACMAEGLILAKTREFQYACRGLMNRPHALNWYREQQHKLGIKTVVSSVPERAVWSDNTMER